MVPRKEPDSRYRLDQLNEPWTEAIDLDVIGSRRRARVYSEAVDRHRALPPDVDTATHHDGRRELHRRRPVVDAAQRTVVQLPRHVRGVVSVKDRRSV